MLSKVSVDKVFMHYLKKMSASGLCPWSPVVDYHPSDRSLPTHVGAHGEQLTLRRTVSACQSSTPAKQH